ncbi:hypothetical protein SAMN04488128_103660 [Chitinophaga eiseniae]|uniref:Uncharacterized protein n=1 Tax=Chitinophaga eiseniae TaxID=634771 RepID=A0A1T4SWW1_9BACT|nr:hypothetical protein SAMN04488128_103660 [Chitinophaga eiseniae]
MGYVKEPKGVDWVVDPKPLTDKDRQIINEAIRYYRTTSQKLKSSGKRSDNSNKKTR